MRRAMTILKGAAILLVALVVTAAAILLSMDFDSYKATIADAVKSATGRELTIAGPLDLEIALPPSLGADGIALADRPESGRPAMLQVGRLHVVVDPWPLLRGEVRVRRVHLEDVELRLVRDSDGRGNWQFGEPAAAPVPAGSQGGGDWHAALANVRLTDTAILYKSERSGSERRVRVDRFDLTGPDLSAPARLTVEGAVERLPVELAGTVGPLSALLGGGATAMVDLEGTIGDRPAALGGAVDQRGEGGGRILFSRLKAELADSAFAGDLLVNLEGDVPHVRATLESSRVDADRLEALLDLLGEKQAETGDPRDRPISVDWMRGIDGQLDLKAAELHYRGVLATDLALRAELRRGLLHVEPAAASVHGGRIDGRFTLDARGPEPRMTLKSAVAGLDFGSIARAARPSTRMSARGDVLLDLRTAGTTRRSLTANLAGHGIVFTTEGTVGNEYWELVAADLVQQVAPWTRGSREGRLSCAVVRLDVTGGIGTASVLYVASDRVTIAGQGQVDLNADRLDLRLTPRPRDASLVSLSTPILVRGPIESPSVIPDPVSVATDVAGAVIGGMINPLYLIVPFLSAGSDDPPCDKVIAYAESYSAEAGRGAGGQRDPTRKPGAIRGLFDSLRRIVE